ncbi:MAG: hypothetical protein LBO72_09850, partial [Helicobacteraceae bacterium]|nr:hypothetical protein [Helicobacteraceae bacterium]
MRFVITASALIFALSFSGCAALLIEQEWLDSGFSAEDYDRTRTWVELKVAPKEAKAWEEAGFVPSYKDSQTERIKRHKNMPNNLIFDHGPNVWRQNGFSQKELGEALESGIPSSRFSAFKPSAIKELKRMRIPPKEWRYYLASSNSQTKNYDLNAVKSLRSAGLSGEQINEWRTAKRQNEGGWTQEEAIAWIKAGVKTPSEAVEAERGGYSPKVWSALKASGVSEADWSYCISNGLSPQAAKAWADAGVKCTRSTPKAYINAKLSPSQVKPWARSGFDATSAIAFIKRGFKADEAKSWLKTFSVDIITISEIAAWKQASFTPSEAKKWRDLTKTPSVAKGYKNAGLTNNRITQLLINNNVAPSAAKGEYRKIYGACGLDFASDRVFLTQAPSSWGDAKTYESIGKCVIPAGFSLFRVLGNNGFLYRI